jgi:hypothetical protein
MYLVIYNIFLVVACTNFTKDFSGDKIEKNVMGGSCSWDGEGRIVYSVLVE